MMMSSSTSEKKKIVLTTSDKQTFEIEEKIAVESQTIKHVIDEGCADGAIPLPNVTAKTLALVIEYCKKKSEEPAEADLKAFEAEFVKVDLKALFDILQAANYLDIKSLLDVTSQAVANLMHKKMPAEIRTMFNITNDFTEEEEKAVRAENAWAFE